MREIKFRAWDGERMWDSSSVDDNGDWCTDADYCNGPENTHGTKIQMQFTGLKDKNGKDIYFDDLYKGFAWIESDGHSIVDEITVAWWIINIDKMNNPMSRIEIVGNIHQNPELLKVKQTSTV